MAFSLAAMLALVFGLDAAGQGRWVVVAVALAILAGYVVTVRRVLGQSSSTPKATVVAPRGRHAAPPDEPS